MSGIEANHGDTMPMVARRNTRQALSLDNVPAGTGGSKRWTEIGKGTRFTVTIGTAIALAMGIWALAMWFRNMTDALKQNTEAVNRLSSVVWMVQDEVDLMHEMGRLNPSLVMPSPKKIVSERLKP